MLINKDVNLGGDERESLAFIEAFKKRFGRDPAPLTMHGYAAAKTLLRALETVASGRKAITGEVLRDALARSDVEAPLGRVKFDERATPSSTNEW